MELTSNKDAYETWRTKKILMIKAGDVVAARDLWFKFAAVRELAIEIFHGSII